MISKDEILLDSEYSLSNKIWIKPTKEIQKLATNFQQISSVPYPLALLLSQRGININQIDTFLDPKLKFIMPDPSSLLDIDKAIKIIIKAIKNKKKIAIFADYDVDGGSSAALLYKWFENFKIQPTVYVPDRDKEGYGPSNEAMTSLSKNHDIIICVDCGSVSNEPIESAKKNKCLVIVIDHHQGGDNNTKADALVNPNRLDEKSELHYLCATGVTFLMLAALNRQLKQSPYKAPDILSYLDLVALATISDVVPLVKLNRAFVRSGLKMIQMGKNIGLKSLIEISDIATPINAKHLAFILGPKINAGGRLGASMLGTELLIEKNQAKAIIIAKTLHSLNDNRKKIEHEMTEKVFDYIKNKSISEDFIWVADRDLKSGITGIIASRVLEKFNKTCLIISIDENGIGKGSGRAESNHNLGKAITQLADEKLILKGGGHTKAAGITVENTKINEAMKRLTQILATQKSIKSEIFTLNINSVISINAITLDLIEDMERAGPFGASAPPPIFVIKNCKLKWIKILGNKHLRFHLCDENDRKIQSIFFRALDNKAGIYLFENPHNRYHFAGNIEINDWLGKRSPNFIVQDIALVNI